MVTTQQTVKRAIILSLVFALAFTSLIFSISTPNHVSAAESTVEVYFSSESSNTAPKSGSWYTNPAFAMSGVEYQLSKQADIPLTDPSGANVTTIQVNPEIEYQTILGVGTSLEESTIYNLSLMSAEKRDEVLRKLIDPVNGAGMNVFRITFGASDFTGREFYSYEDIPGQFSIQKDIDFNIISTVQQAIEIGNETGNPIKIFASSWSAPAWMKTNNSLIGGFLKWEHHNDLAAYYRKAIQAYEELGIPIYAMTIQNEPLYAAPDYPSMQLTPENEREIILALKSEFDTHGITTKLWSFDHNFEQVWDYIPEILNHPEANAAVDGVAFHDYAGEPTRMTEVHNNYSNKNVLVTERTVWGTSGADRIAQYFRNWAISYNAWVTMLDQNIAPEQWTGTPDPTMLIQSPDNRDTYWTTPEYNFIAQFSKFIQDGAKRIDSNYGSANTVTNVSFLNPDNSIVSVVINQTDSVQTFKILSGGKEILSTIPAKTVGTYTWLKTEPGNGNTGSDAPIGSIIAIKAMANDKFVSAEDEGISPLIANRDAAQGWEQFEVVDGGDGFIALKSLANGKYVTAENGGDSDLIANRDTIQGWEQFRWIDNGDGTFSLQANANGLYVTAEDGGNSPLIANRNSIDGWEKFQYFIQ
ncbi:glycoside hydrolase family 30 beta sandwich domain-containing protein [Chengkuizengella axinellae]|uniref:Glycoside hydrolase family 30 beta sandwich domain-containing protein n=1 Tax=Chengkuizengella axinellae TaxID=3064388 RepID=A0ABT9J1C4_9BACL|nr:glycoside hydrolase family 30 beta sandwich domain-containing protein [Chengkuizengella sp. 2205SS18-9]MDP5275222.1 glycoside hydrolase family 30 beta sandwich domain-containing protein [Chengkuizengella sp. 2205SS18-9]